MNMNIYGPSAFRNSSDMSTNFEFSTPAATNLGTENPTFSSSSSLSKPRLAKTRKSLNSKLKGSSETRKNDPGFNPFNPISDNVTRISYRVGDDALGGEFGSKSSDFDGIKGVSRSRSGRHVNLKVTSKVEKVGNELVDEIRKLRLANQSDNKLNDSGLPCELSKDLNRMNLGSSSSVGPGGSSGGIGVDLISSNSVRLGAELPNDLSKLNLRDNGEIGGVGQNFAFSAASKNEFVFGSSRAKFDSVVDSTLPENIKNLKLEDSDINDGIKKSNIGGTSEGPSDNDNLEEPTSLRKTTHGGKTEEDLSKLNFSQKVSLGGEQDKQSSVPQIHEINKKSSNSSFTPGDEAERSEGFSFNTKPDSTKMPTVEFTTPEPKVNMFAGSNVNMGFRSKKGPAKVPMSRGKKGKVKEPNPVLVSLVNNFSPMETSTTHEPSDSYSPMDVSPCYETHDDAQSGNDLVEELVTATQGMDINVSNDSKHEEENVDVSDFNANNTVVDDCVSTVEDISFRTAAVDLDNGGQIEVESKYEVESSDQTQYFSASSSITSDGSSFKFGASSSSSHGQVSATMLQQRKKNRMKVGPDVCSPCRIDTLSDATSSLKFSPIPEVSVLLPQLGKNDKSGISKKLASPTSRPAGVYSFEEVKKGIASPSQAARLAQESCEKWRLRGNQAYTNGDLKKAEDCYTQGLSCIPRHETSRECLRSLVLCYSNRAAARMSIGRMSEALQDCLVAAEIDPNFFRVQLRAANCYLALGKIGTASRYFKKLLQSNDVCVERKIIIEASDGLQKAQKVSESIDRSNLLLDQKTIPDTVSALEIIAEALNVSPYSEQLLESKAGALFMSRRYEEVIQLCEETVEIAEKNSSISGTNEELSNMDAEILENYSFRTWRFSFIFKSYFYLGKLEEALEFLEKQEKWSSMVAKCGNETLETLIPQLSTVHELIRHKSAGNGAFQAGRHTEAVEHYSAALSFNVESRPFAAVCFGNRAAAFQALGQITDAVADCSLAIALDGNYLKAISRRATLFEMIRDYDQAAKDLQTLVSLLTTQVEEKANHGSVADLRQARQKLYLLEEQARRGIPLNFYLILGVEASVSAVDLKKAYRKAALRHHPDKAGQSLTRSECGDDGVWKEIAEDVYKDTDKLFKMIGEAYGVLSDPSKRSQYDMEEEMRNGTKKTSNMTSRTQNEASYTEERGGYGRQWREGWRTSANPYSRGFEPTKPARYY